jgi:hypothetical protein
MDSVFTEIKGITRKDFECLKSELKDRGYFYDVGSYEYWSNNVPWYIWSEESDPDGEKYIEILEILKKYGLKEYKCTY